jgi:ferredoxin
MCYQDPCAKCLRCGRCVRACYGSPCWSEPGETLHLDKWKITYNTAHSYSALVKNTPPEMSDDDAFDLMDSIRKEMYDTRGTD